MMRRILYLVLTALIAVGCESAPTYHHDVEPILQARCVSCHSTGGIAPFDLGTYDEASAMASAMAVAVQDRTMPPWAAAPNDIGYRHNPSLSNEQIATIVQWRDAGAPRGEASENGPTIPPMGEDLARVNLELAMSEAYTPKSAPDDYRCFPIVWPETETTYVTGFDVIPGNQQLVHHVAVYMIPPEYAHLTETWEAEDGESGYTCYGGPTGGRDQSFPTLLLSAWVPGGQGVLFPEGTGIQVVPGTVLALQIHYNTATVTDQQDQTTLQFQLEPSVAHRAVYAPWLDLNWVLGDMTIPAGQSRVEHGVRDDPRWFFEMFASDFDLSAGFDIHATLFHMHQLGVSGHVKLVRSDGSEQDILKISQWDFNWQREYQLMRPIRFEPGDEIDLGCVWDNSESNQPAGSTQARAPQTVSWGEGTGDEMCVANMLITQPID